MNFTGNTEIEPVFILFNLAVVVFIFYNIFGRRRKNYPPGPIGLPILGNLLSIGEAPHLSFQYYAKKYGPIFSLRLGNENAIILHGAKLIKEAYNDPELNGRPEKEAWEQFLAGGKKGIILGEGKSHSEQRLFAIKHLRSLGFGKQSIENLIMPEVNELFDWFRSHKGKPFVMRRRFALAVVNSIWTLITGHRFEHSDPKLAEIMEQLETTADAVLSGKGKSLLILFYPNIAKLFPNWSGWNFLKNSIIPRHEIFKTVIKEHKDTFQEAEPRDFIDAYLQEVKRTTNVNSCFHEKNHDEHLHATMADLFLAGVETTTSTLRWAVLYFIHFPEIQAKVYDEIEGVVGKSRSLSLADREFLPYTEAFILELSRITAIISFGVPHCATRDIEFHGYKIPKGTSIYSSIYSTHYDPDVWGDPENFRPERFLSPDGLKVQRNDSLIPFSVGKRTCMGETFARDELFLFLANMVQCFRIEAEPGKPKPSLNPRLGQISLEPYTFNVVMKERV